MAAVLFNQKLLTGSFQPSAALLITGSEITLGFELVVAALATAVEWYLEFSDLQDAAGTWYREVAEEDMGLGVVRTPAVVRSFMGNNALTLAVGTHRLDAEVRRRRKFARVQMRKVVGGSTVTTTVVAPFGTIAA